MAKGKSKSAGKARGSAKSKPKSRARPKPPGRPKPSARAKAGKSKAAARSSGAKSSRAKSAAAKSTSRTARKPVRAAKPAARAAVKGRKAALPAGKAARPAPAPAKGAPAKGRASERPGRRGGFGNGELPKTLDPKDLRKSKMPHIDDATLAKIVARLLQMRAESKNIISHQMQSDLNQQVESGDVGDDLDQAVTERDREFNLIMHQRHLRRLQQIDEALQRIADGAYGYCEGTEEPINPKRLLIQPLARYSLEYQEQQEKMLGRSPEDVIGGVEEPLVPEE